MEERIQKIIAAAGIASRRAAEEMLRRGEVTVNGKVVTELGTKADLAIDHIKVKGKLLKQISAQQHRYILLNKPRGCVSTTADSQGRPSVLDILPAQERKGLHLVGRLDFNSEGLIILTNDGGLTHLLTAAGKVPKVYMVKVHGFPEEESLGRLRSGIPMDGSSTAPARIELVSQTRAAGNSWFRVTLTEGKNQQIRRMFASVGHPVSKLRRVRIGHLSDDKLPLGAYRELKPSEVQRFFKEAKSERHSS